MNTDEHGYGWEDLTGEVIGCAYRVSNALGAGFLEKVYENALAVELRRSKIRFTQQSPIAIHYEGELVGEYTADFLVDDTVLVELKACRALDDVHTAQCMNYLKATNKPVCLLIKFGNPKVQVRRILNPDNPEAWRHPADNADDYNPSPSIRVHPCSSVVPNP